MTDQQFRLPEIILRRTLVRDQPVRITDDCFCVEDVAPMIRGNSVATADSRKPQIVKDVSGAGTVERVVKLLVSIAEARGGVSIKVLCQSLGLPASTVHRLLSLLIKEGMIERSPTRAVYQPGLEYVRIGSLVAAKVELVDLAKPVMRALVEECNETCVLLRYVPRSRKVMAVHIEYSSHPLRYQIDMFQPHSLLWGATGRAVLAFLPADEIDAAIKDNDLSPTSGERIPARNALLKELSDIRERGYAITHGQKIVGAVGFAAPLLNSERHVVGCLSVTVPEARHSQRDAVRVSGLLLASAERLCRHMGYDSA